MTQDTNTEAALSERADAIQLVAQMLQPPRELRGEDDMIHPHMPEDDAALVRHIRAMIDRGDHLADTIRWAREALNEMCRKWMEGEQSADEALTEFFERDGMPSRTPVYEWQKSRERTAFIAKHRHAEAYQEARNA